VKLFRTSNIETVLICQLQFSFITEKRTDKFKDSLTKANYSYSRHVLVFRLTST